jgi:hypothetical protein
MEYAVYRPRPETTCIYSPSTIPVQSQNSPSTWAIDQVPESTHCTHSRIGRLLYVLQRVQAEGKALQAATWIHYP